MTRQNREHIYIVHYALHPIYSNEFSRKMLLREVLEWHIAFPWKSLVQSPTDGFHLTFADDESNNGANNDTADASKSNTFKKHPVAKKWHRRHLFCIQRSEERRV